MMIIAAVTHIRTDYAKVIKKRINVLYPVCIIG